MKRNGVPQITAADLADAVRQRMGAYLRSAGGRRIRAFISVGGAAADLGAASKPLPTGIVDRRVSQLPNPSVMRAMAEQGAVLVNFLDPVRLAYRYRFPVAPVPLPPLARGRMFIEKKYPVGLAVAFALVIVALLFVVIEFDLDFYVRRALGLKPRPVMGEWMGG
jgi:hypothetical protein